MKSSQRHAAAAVTVVALSLMSVPVFAQSSRNQEPPQRGGPPGEKTPYILVTTFASADRKLGVESANEMRHRLQSEHSAKELYVVPKANIDNTLAASGYPPDSALNAADLMELSKQLHGEYVLDGTATKTGKGDAVRFDVRVLLKAGVSNTLAQPLPPADGKDLGDAARLVERSLTEMIKGMPPYRTCIDDLRAQKNDEAAAAARAGIAAYPASVLSRICLLNAYTNAHASPDSIISVSTQILASDPTSMLALVNLADAYAAKGDTSKAIETNLKIYRVDPSNTAVAQSIVQQLAQSGAPDRALPIIDSLLKDNPADVGMVRTKWLLQLRAKQFKQAYATSDEYVKLAPDSATEDFYNRMIGVAQTDSNAVKVQEYAAKGSQRFPKQIAFLNILAQSYIKAGQMQQALAPARRATQLDPKNQNAWLLAIAAANGANMRDSSAAFAQQAINNGADKNTFGTALLGPTQDLFTKAQASKARADWEAVLKSAQAVDSAAASPQSKFFVGVSAFSIAADMVNELQTQAQAAQKSNKKAEKEAACGTVKQMEDLLTTTSIAMPAGASVSKETAGQIMGGVTQLTDYMAQVKKAFACK
ncbi:MAG: tetratricopeptide repeat protein [Gemmatimonadaceae bacterium]